MKKHWTETDAEEWPMYTRHWLKNHGHKKAACILTELGTAEADDLGLAAESVTG